MAKRNKFNLQKKDTFDKILFMINESFHYIIVIFVILEERPTMHIQLFEILVYESWAM